MKISIDHFVVKKIQGTHPYVNYSSITEDCKNGTEISFDELRVRLSKFKDHFEPERYKKYKIFILHRKGFGIFAGRRSCDYIFIEDYFPLAEYEVKSFLSLEPELENQPKTVEEAIDMALSTEFDSFSKEEINKLALNALNYFVLVERRKRPKFSFRAYKKGVEIFNDKSPRHALAEWWHTFGHHECEEEQIEFENGESNVSNNNDLFEM